MQPEFELVVPAYNEAESLPALLTRTVAAACDAGMVPGQFSLVVVDNGSSDDSAAVLGRLAAGAHGAWLRVVTVARNQGYGHGLWQGLRSTTAAHVGWSHADLQCDPRDAFIAYALARATPQLLVRGQRQGRAFKETLVSRVFEACATVLLGMRLAEINAQPKVAPRALLAALRAPPQTFAFDLYALYHARKAGMAMRSIAVRFPPRAHGVSRWAASLVGRYRTILGMIGYMWRLRRQEGAL